MRSPALGVEKREIVVAYNVGDNVKITDGPLESFLGTVEEIEPDRRTACRVVVSMFGRETPVELELDQVELVEMQDRQERCPVSRHSGRDAARPPRAAASGQPLPHL